MTLTKADIVKSVRDKIKLKKARSDEQPLLFPELAYERLSSKRAAQLVDTMFEIIKKNLEKGDSVLIHRFGKFKVKFKWARKGRNPRTGESIILDTRRIVTFHCSPKLKEKINKGLAARSK